MFDQSADEGAPDQSAAPIGMRELPPQPAKPVMPAFPSASAPAPQRDDEERPSADDSVIASDDHLEGTFTSRGTVRVEGSVNGRIEAVRVRIQEGARVEADVVVDEAIVAGEFTGKLICRQRLEARPTGRISGQVETFKLMLHEGASVEGEMHMLPDPSAAPEQTIRGTAPLRGERPARETEAPPRSAEGRTSARDSAGATASVPREEPAPRAEASAATPVRSAAAGDAFRVKPRAAAPARSGTNGSTNGNASRL